MLTRNRLATWLSLLLSVVAMLLWRNLFTFSKTLSLPLWAEALPYPVNASAYVMLVCLLPAAIGTNTLRAAAKALLLVSLLAPLAPTLVFALDAIHLSVSLWLNVGFNYLWIVVFSCSVPAVSWFMLRSLAKILSK